MKNYMGFTNEEVFSQLIKPLFEMGASELDVLDSNEKPVDVGSDEEVQDIVFKIGKLECHIALWPYLLAIFITDTLEIMFIKEEDRDATTSSDTHGNVVYNGELTGKTNAEILQIITDIVSLFIGAESFDFSERKLYRAGLSYPRCDYTINIYKKNDMSKKKVFGNIIFHIH